jgi:uncharacterized protein YjbI with pentapeptide repeats
MKVLKPNRLSVITRSFEVQRKFQLGLSILAYFDLTTGKLLEEVELWKFAAKELGKDAAIDVGIPKSRAEYLVHGSVFVPGGAPQETCPVTVTLGKLEKTLYVVGDRFWKGSQQTRPRPFTSMPISWELAYGGPGYERNPQGKGFAPIETDHGPVQFLPNIEAPGRMITSPKQRPEPVGLGPIDITWPQRFSKAGTYDLKWLKELFPAFASDVDWTIHNLAPDDQQQAEPFVGNETIRVANMSPTMPVVEGRLPGFRARAFVSQRQPTEDAFLEVPMRLMTVWLFPHVVKGILVFHGSLQTKEDDAADVVHLMVAAENLGEDKGIPHYQTVLANRLDKEDGVLYAMREQDLLPVVPEGYDQGAASEDAAMVTMEGLLGSNLRRRAEAEIAAARETVRQLGLDPDQHAPGLPPPEEPLSDDPAERRRQLREMEEQTADLEAEQAAKMEKTLKGFEPLLKLAGIPPEKLRGEIETPRTGPPDFTADAEITRIRGLAADARALGVTIDELEEWSADEELHQKWREAEQHIKDAYLMSAHCQSPAPRLGEADCARIREQVLVACRAREPFAYRDLTGADLSGLDLRGANFRKGWLESVSLAGANLEGADFSEAVLARADLSGARLGRTNFKGANLGGARLAGVVIDGTIDLSDTILMKTDLTDTALDGATISRAELNEAVFGRTTMRNVVAEDVTLYKTDLRGLSFAGAKLDRVTFIDSDLREVEFSNAEINETSFIQCQGRGTKFVNVRGKMIAAALCETFAEADFRGAVLETLNLRGLDLSRSDFSGATLRLADLSEANLGEAKLYRLVAREGRFIRTDFRDADLTSADLMGADLQKADIRGTKFTGANLYGANFGRVRSDTGTDLHDSNQKKVTIYPLRHE